MSGVIDWDEAMQQCGDDEEFLRELLDDLRSETDTQMEKMEEVLQVNTMRISSEVWSLVLWVFCCVTETLDWRDRSNCVF